MTGRVISSDLFGIADRLKSIDDGYFIFLNYKTGRFEVHNKKDSPSLCTVLPFDRLDERAYRHVLYTRAERVKQIVADMERYNQRQQKETMYAARRKAESAAGV